MSLIQKLSEPILTIGLIILVCIFGSLLVIDSFLDVQHLKEISQGLDELGELIEIKDQMINEQTVIIKEYEIILKEKLK